MFQYLVAKFHEKFGHPIAKFLKEVQEVPYATRKFRMDRIREEAHELVEAIEQGILHKIAREAMDLIYVVVGTLIVFGIPVEAAFEIVHKANMAKEPHPDGEFGKPIKPADWQSPDVEMLALMKEGREYRLALEQQTAAENARAAAVTQSYADGENKLLDAQLKQPEVAVVVPLDQAPVPTVVVETPVVATTSTTESPAPVDTPTSASDASAVPPSTDSAPAVS